MAHHQHGGGAGYNYRTFPVDMEQDVFRAFPHALKVGEPAPDGEVTRLADGARLRLSELWRQGMLVLEFGSIT